MTKLSLEGLTEEALLAELPPQVRSKVQKLSEKDVPDEAIGSMLALVPAASIAKKGAGTWRDDLWDAVVRELRVLCCTDEAQYADLRAKWSNIESESAGTAVAALSGAIGATLGLAAGVVAPIVVWGLITILRVGIGAFCAGAPTTESAEADDPDENPDS